MRARLLAPLIVAALAGCTTQNHQSVHVTMLCSAPNDPQSCAYSSECDAEYIGDAILDVAGGGGYYFAAIQVDNQLVNNKNTAIGQLNTHDAWVESYTVSYQNLPYAKFSKEISGTAFVPAEGSAVVGVRLIPEAIVNAIVADGLVGAGSYRDIVANVRVWVRLGDGSHLESGEFLLPMRICNGCLDPSVYAGFPCPTAGDVRVTCPNYGQTPVGTKCVTP